MVVADVQQQLLAQLDAVLRDKNQVAGQAPEVADFIMRARAAIHRVAGRPSVYADQCEELMKSALKDWAKGERLIGIVSALRSDIDAGYLISHTELIHSELFSDFLEMAQHLLDQGYKDAAAVIAGSSLEAHLRQLCHKSDIDTEKPDGSHKKADTLNAELSKAEVCTKQDQKNVTAWLGLRNKAAHGEYDQYHASEISLLISAIRDFITRNPA